VCGLSSFEFYLSDAYSLNLSYFFVEIGLQGLIVSRSCATILAMIPFVLTLPSPGLKQEPSSLDECIISFFKRSDPDIHPVLGVIICRRVCVILTKNYVSEYAWIDARSRRVLSICCTYYGGHSVYQIRMTPTPSHELRVTLVRPFLSPDHAMRLWGRHINTFGWLCSCSLLSCGVTQSPDWWA